VRKSGIQEIARLAGVSIGTVDRALHNRKGISEKTRRRVLGIAEALGYKPNLAARSLSARRVPIRIGVCIPREIHCYFDQLRHGLMTEARRFEHLGIEIVYRPTERLGVGEVETTSGLLKDGVRALIIAPGDPANLAPVINEAENKGIRVICVDSDAPGTARSTVICVDAEVSGHLAAELMGRFVNPGAEVAIVTGMLTVEHHSKKTKGFCDLFPQLCQGGRVVQILEAHDDEEEAFQKSFELLETHKSLAGIYVNTGNSLPVCRAVSVLGLSGKIALITTELFKDLIPFFEKGTIFASLTGRPLALGRIAMQLVVEHFLRGVPFPAQRFLAPQVVMRSNIHLFPEVAYSKEGE
jgi:LacI family transcriptional regulator